MSSLRISRLDVLPDLVKTSSSLPATLVKEWKKCIQKHFGRSVVRFSFQIMCDIAAVNCGVKPSFLFDYGPAKPDEMLNLILDLRQQGLLHNVSEPTTFLIISVGGDVLLCNMVVLRDHLTCVLNKRTVAFTDISKTNTQPKLVEQLDSLGGNIPDVLEDILTICNGESENNFEITFPPSLNLTSLVGILLGYPIIYWFNRSNDYDGNSLEINSLLVFKVIVQMRTSCTCQYYISKDSHISLSHICDNNSKDITSNSDQEMFRHAIYSFSVPENLAVQVTPYVQTWMDNLSANSSWQEIFYTLQLERNLVFAPAVTL